MMRCARTEISCSVRLTGQLERLLTLFEALFESTVFQGVKEGRTSRAVEDSTVLCRTFRAVEDLLSVVSNAFQDGAVGRTSSVEDGVGEGFVTNAFLDGAVGRSSRANEDTTGKELEAEAFLDGAVGRSSREKVEASGEGLVANAFLDGSVGRTSKDTVFEVVAVGKTCKAVKGK